MKRIGRGSRRAPWLPPTLLIVAILAAPVFAPGESAGKKSSMIDSVTVYADRAEITRMAAIKLAAGETEIVFGGLPASLDNNSIQVWGIGAAHVTLEGVSVEMEPPPEVPEGEVALIEEKIQDLQDRKYLVQNRKNVAEFLIKTLSQVKSSSDKPEKEMRWTDTAEMSKVADIVSGGLLDAYGKVRDLDARLYEINSEINALQKELRKIKSPSGGRTKQLNVTLNVTRAGDVNIMFSYIVPGAMWTPAYDLRAIPDEKKVEITSHAEIVQKTGEDWDNVRLSVSTAKPGIGGTPPAFNPIYLTFYYPAYKEAPKRAAKPAAKSEALGAEMEMDDSVMSLEEKEETFAADIETAEVSHSGTAATFTVKQRKDVPSDGEAHRVPLGADVIDAKFEHASWPEARPLVFLRAKMKNKTGHPFVAGSVSVFLDSSYVGSTNIEDWIPGQEKTVSLGVDQGVRIERKEVRRDVEETGSRIEVNYEYEITVTNSKRKPVKIEVYDRIPVSRHDDIAVRKGDITPEPAEIDDEGIVTWSLKMDGDDKNNKAVIRLIYTVRYPKNRRITGLP